ncbi:hypothetical protein F0562_028835 [Nyssa sinensis]|uniref:non-specific serine/threonine protein kinase n=1 Tax=Nyssa sinensis TaxID=561372 RepID=A0A5J5B3H0_9ASTE|nr:hypothetical protein F0562_028835 [Nyssa sinensis]
MLLLYSLFHLCIIIPPATPLNFSFPSITTQQNANIMTYRDADISDEGLQLTPKGIVGEQIWRAGRATYKEPLHLWDKASGNLTDFDTSFSFIIDSEGRPTYADGLAFFLVPNGSQIQVARASGLGLPINHATGNPTSNFVAVEFDTIHNSEWGLDNKSGPHVGININSVRSIASENWTTDIPRGKENRAWIRYNSTLQILTVAFTNFINDTQVIHNFTYPINLRMHLPEWVDVGFSASTGGLAELHIVKSWEFSSNLQIDEGLEIDQGTKKALVVGLSVGSCVLVLGLGLVGIGLWKKRSRAKEEDGSVFDHSMDDEFEKGSGPKKFSYGELAGATNNFAEEEKLGEGGFGGVYRGFLRESYSFIAVKKVSSRSQQGIKEYKSEVKIISRLRHRNLVQLIGWCHEKGAFLLVYEFMSNGSLDSHLFNGKSLLNWVMRYRIAQALGSVLLYLHEEWEQCVVHRDIKSSNVMLDSNFNAKLGDFGLARLIDHEQGSQTTAIAGTLGYLAPECFTTGKASKKSDVYSFGIVALEIACGRKAIDPNAPESQRTMVEWVWNLYGMGKLLEAADPKLGANFDEEEMERLMIVGLWCANPQYTDRPSIRQATRVLHSESPLPSLPSKMPVSTISAPRASLEVTPNGSAMEQQQKASRATYEQPLRLSNKASGNFPTNFSVVIDSEIADITTYQDAYISGQGLQLTPNEHNTDRQQKAGRATYKEPLHLWDKASGNLTDFDTNFSFIIDSEGTPVYDDGFAFVLLPNHSDILLTGGGAFGLPINSTTFASPFVAVEFDTYHNGLESCGPTGIQGTHKKRSRAKEENGFIFDLSMDDEFEKGSGPKKFSYGELARATNNFAEEEKLGEGGFVGVYRGFIREFNSYFAVKRVSRGSKQGRKEDIKASNIMLDSNFNAKLGDFGLARLVDHERGLQTTVLAGTMGYMAPECVITGKASKESDVYSFGVVALEIACGRKPIDLRTQETQTRMLDWVWDLYRMGKLLEAADKKLCGDFDEQEMECLMIVGLSCVHPDFNLRPSIRQAINVLNFGSPSPILPSKMPVPTYLAPPVNFPISFSYGAAASESSQIQSSSYSYNTDSSKDKSSATASPSAALLHTI